MDLLKKLWRYGRWVLLALVVAYIGLVIWRVWAIGEEERSAEVVAAIHAQEISRDLVLGTGLPEAPDPATNDATVEGFDTNDNGIRDDAELTIFLWHRDSARIRAAELQYAMAIQAMLTKVFDSNTWVAAAEEEDRATLCMAIEANQLDEEITRIKDLVLDTDLRRQKYTELHRKYEVSYGSMDAPDCDIDLSSFLN